jgi:ferredoxin-NADP reductase/ferredoxin
MATITWRGAPLACEPGETVLARLEREGVVIASSCRAGACQTCLVRAARGRPPAAAQKGLSPALRDGGYFLSCQAIVEDDLEVAAADDLPAVPAVLRRVDRVSADVARLTLELSAPFAYRAGQFVHVVRADGLARPYSLASVPGAEPLVELHVKKMPGGAMSGYLYDEARVGEGFTVRGPAGDCVYAGDLDEPLVLAGTGTGLAPLLGILRDALGRGHRGPIELHHGALREGGLYAHAELRALARRHPQVTYAPCVLEGPTADPEIAVGALPPRVLAAVKAKPGCRVFLCGPPELVVPLRKGIFLAGTKLDRIHADAFVTAARPA